MSTERGRQISQERITHAYRARLVAEDNMRMFEPARAAEQDLEPLLRERLCGDAKALKMIRDLAKKAGSGAVERILDKLWAEARPVRKRASTDSSVA